MQVQQTCKDGRSAEHGQHAGPCMSSQQHDYGSQLAHCYGCKVSSLLQAAASLHNGVCLRCYPRLLVPLDLPHLKHLDCTLPRCAAAAAAASPSIVPALRVCNHSRRHLHVERMEACRVGYVTRASFQVKHSVQAPE